MPAPWSRPDRPGSCRRAFALLLVVALVAAACSGDDGPEEAGGPGGDQTSGADDTATVDEPDDDIAGRWTFTDDDCEFTEPADVSTSCGWLEVPMRWDAEGGADTVRLHVGVFSAGPNDEPPVVYLEGGPGGDPLSNVALAFDQLFSPIVATRDVVVIAQRGTGPSEPSMQCSEVLEADLDLLDEDLPVDEELDRSLTAYEQCADRIGREIDFAGVNSVQSAHDIEALRRALGHDQWYVMGISYGTRLAQTLARLFPDGIAGMVLDSVLSVEREPTTDVARTAQRSFETLFAGCAESAACAEAYPDLEERFFAVVDELEADPVEIVAVDALTGESHDAVVDGEDLMGIAFQALYSKSSFAGLPELVAQLEQDDTSGLSTMLGIELANAAFVSVGTYWSVVCHEEIPFVAEGDVEAGLTGDERYDVLAEVDVAEDFLVPLCEAFDGGAAEAVEDEVVTADIPTLVLAGSYDPITPPADGEAVASGFSPSTFVELPNTGHGALVDECAQEIAIAFFADPTATPDSRCSRDVPEPAWVPDLFTDVEFASFDYDAGMFGASGVAPVGWDLGFDGTFSRTDNVLRSSVIVQQVVEGEIADLVVDQIGALGDDDPVLADTLVEGGRTWERWELQVPGSVIDVVVSEDDGTTRLVLLQHSPEDHEAALEALLPPMLESLEP